MRAKLRISATVDDKSTPSACNAVAAVLALNAQEGEMGTKQQGCVAAAARGQAALEAARTKRKVRADIEKGTNQLDQRVNSKHNATLPRKRTSPSGFIAAIYGCAAVHCTAESSESKRTDAAFGWRVG
jgi:hypothetical protein